MAGSVGLVSVLIARHGESFRGTGSGWLLNTLDQLGFIHPPPEGGVNEAKAPTLFTLTDESALNALLRLGVLLGVVAFALAIWAAARRETSLYLGAGLVCGGLCLTAAHQGAGMASLLVGAAAVMAARSAE